MNSHNTFVRSGLVAFEEKCKQLNQSPLTIWMTGLSASGKSSLAYCLEHEFFLLGIKTKVLDGDNLRRGLNNDLDFSLKSRSENIRRVAEVAKLFNDEGYVVITSLISPSEQDRSISKTIIGDDRFVLVYLKASLETCESRDYKGLYARARSGEIADFTGISSDYEIPTNPQFILDTEKSTVDHNAHLLLSSIKSKVIKVGG